ncbi:hypothetical protein ACJ73_02822 [Blastomyces percursus]|uniref:Protein kinase domain-containing protein n=1 Tax=Blastomyces percursus TaxID=1658174 RepID=A0A1J9RDR5_9EURO|nr:hypothetical protein ACJ73_02822 [Blastomyces percursus]
MEIRLERYYPGGFNPLKLGDRLCDGRYSIVQNLGFGGSSTSQIFFNEDATIDITTGAPFEDSLEERYDWFVNTARRRSDKGEDEKKAFLHMIWMMLQYLPSDRATIQHEYAKMGVSSKAGN